MDIDTTNPLASSAVANAAQGLGALVWWSLADTRVSPDRLRTILAMEGGDPSIVPDIDQCSAVKRAVRDWTQGAGKTDRYRAEVAQVAGDEMTIGILRREKPTAQEVRWVQVDSVCFDAKAAAWLSRGTTGEAASFVSEADEVRSTHDHQFIRPAILIAGLKAANAVCLRDRGGVYYVPRQNQDDLDRLARIVARIGKCHLDIVHAMATEAGRQSIAQGAQAGLRDGLGELITRIEGWAASTRRVSEGNSAALLGELATLKQQAALYADALSISMDDLQAAVEAARVEALRILGAGNDAPAAPTAAAPTGGATPSKPPASDVVDALRRAMADSAFLADGSMMIAPAVIATHGLRTHTGQTTDYQYWNHGAGCRAAKDIGYTAKLRGGTTSASLQLSPIAPDAAPTDSPKESCSETEPTENTASNATPVEVQPQATAIATDTAAVATDSAANTDTNTVDTRIEAVESDEAVSDIREKFAAKTPAEVRSIYEQIIGKSAGAQSKAVMIDRLVRALT